MADGRALWQDYLFLTKEIERFLKSKDFDLFLELMDQREQLQASIEKCTDDFSQTREGRDLATEIGKHNQAIVQHLHAVLNLMKQQQAISQKYDGPSDVVGVYLDQKR